MAAIRDLLVANIGGAGAACYGWQNLLGFTGYVNTFTEGQCTYFDGTPVLPQWTGWLVVCAFGFIFTIFTSAALYVDSKYGGTKATSEAFNTAGRSVKAGLTACDIVSKWTWAATLLQSSNVAYKYGVSGPFWYASGATIQVLLFAILAVEIKRKAPTAHTCLEIVKARWGTPAHIVFFVFCILTNIIVTSMLILGGAATVTALTGMNIYAASMLIPVGVMFYTAHGGLRAGYMAAWSHVGLVYIALLVFSFMVYASGLFPVGSISAVYDNLSIMPGAGYSVPGNKEGSYLTMWSLNGLIFGIINVIGNFGTVFVDQAYWQGAIGALPSATYRGYLIGGLCWFAVPFTMATAMGLGARAMNLPITYSESGAGLVPAAVAQELMGMGGAFLLMFQLWMAVTAAGSAEQIAVSTLVAYDIYRTYINKKATGKQIILVSRVMIMVYGILSGVLAIVLKEIGLNLGWVYLFMGIVIGSAVAPMAFSVTWGDCSPIGAVCGAIGGLVCAVITWIVTASSLNGGVISIATLGGDYPMLAGNLVAIFMSAIICVVISLIKPQKYDWALMKEIPLLEEDPNAHLNTGDASPEALTKALRYTYITGGVLTLVLVIAWPLLALPAGVFSKGYFYMWIIIALIWGLVAAAICVLLPWIEAREHLAGIIKAVAAGRTQAMPGQAVPWPAQPAAAAPGFEASKDVATEATA